MWTLIILVAFLSAFYLLIYYWQIKAKKEKDGYPKAEKPNRNNRIIYLDETENFYNE